MATNSRVRIVSDGTATGTKVLVDGIELQYVTCAKWEHLSADHSPTATFVVACVEVDAVSGSRDRGGEVGPVHVFVTNGQDLVNGVSKGQADVANRPLLAQSDDSKPK